MFFKQIQNVPLAQWSYLIGCQATGEAIVVDPTRDIQPYLDVARAEGLRITHVTETHIHADFVSGLRELASRTGATAFLSAEGGNDWQYAFASKDGATLLRDGDVIKVGNIRLDVMHTPGHTPEHLSFVVTDERAAAGAVGILSGDFVFVGDVGRPDLLEKAAGHADTMRNSARQLFASLQRFRKLEDHLQLWPGHGAGSACGKALGAMPFSTVGYEKRANWALLLDDENRFVDLVLEGQPDPPTYFARMKVVNRTGPGVVGTASSLPLIDVNEVMLSSAAQKWIVDLRPSSEFLQAHLPGSLSLPWNKSFLGYAGWLLPSDEQIILLTAGDDATLATRVASELRNIGVDNVSGWIPAENVLAALRASGREAATTKSVDVSELDALLRTDSSVQVVDVRAMNEWDDGHIAEAKLIPLGRIPASLDKLDETTPYVHCQLGARSAIATSLLHRLGRTDAVNVTGGYAEWVRRGLPVSGQ